MVLLAAVVSLLLARTFRFTFPSPAFAERTGRATLALAVGTILLRLVLLPWYPIPVPSGADDFGYWLLADTLRHLRLANPPHAFPEFFEQIFVLQRPTYSSMFNLGQGIALAIGWILFGHPWAGVLISGAALSAGCYWTLRGWTTPGWALTGGTIAAMEFGPLSYWTNSYWGGAVSACAGCLVFGALPRWNTNRHGRYALLLGLGLALQLVTRPFEFLLLVGAVALALPWLSGGRARLVLIATPVIAGAGCLIALQNKAVTGSWTTTPYLAYRDQYGVPATFTFQRNPIPHQPLNGEQQLDYEAESAIHGTASESLGAYIRRFCFRLRFYRFFLLPPLYLAALAFLLQIRTYRQLSIALSIILFAAGSNFYPYFYPHYVAAIAPLFLLMSVEGLRKIDTWRPAAGALLLLCGGYFLFWYVVRVSSHEALASYESWDFINWGDPQGRIAIAQAVDRTPGNLLVFVHYAPGHAFSEWIHNAADIDSSRVVWARDLGDTENRRLRQHYPERRVLLCEPDATPPRIREYVLQNGPFEEVR